MISKYVSVIQEGHLQNRPEIFHRRRTPKHPIIPARKDLAPVDLCLGSAKAWLYAIVNGNDS